MINIFEDQSNIMKLTSPGHSSLYNSILVMKKFNHLDWNETLLKYAVEIYPLYEFLGLEVSEEFDKHYVKGMKDIYSYNEFKKMRQAHQPKEKGYVLRKGEMSHEQAYKRYRELYKLYKNSPGNPMIKVNLNQFLNKEIGKKNKGED